MRREDIVCGQIATIPPAVDKDVAQARWDYPWGIFCGECNCVNDWADDCGWFTPELNVALCRECYRKSGHQTAER